MCHDDSIDFSKQGALHEKQLNADKAVLACKYASWTRNKSN